MSKIAITPEELNELLAAHTAGSSGEWLLSRGIMGKDLRITTSWREGMSLAVDDGPITSVPTERLELRNKKDRDSGYKHVSVKSAEADAKLIVAAVNALPRLISAIQSGGNYSEVAWLIEWPADRHGPIRYFSLGEPPVINASDAMRFARKVDAERMMSHEKVSPQAKAVQHQWCPPALLTKGPSHD